MLRQFVFSTTKEKIIFGINVIENLPKEVKELIGEKKEIAIITDSGIVKAGIFDKIADLLKKAGYNVHLFDKVEPEPRVNSYEEAKNFIRTTKPDLVIGLGGGSPMDVASTASALLYNPGEAIDYVGPPFFKFKERRAPLIMIPTTSGTGAEVTFFDVIIVNDAKRDIIDSKLFADVAIVDPMLTITLPPTTTAHSGIDALSHNIEAFLSIKSSPITDVLALQAIGYIHKYLPRAFRDGNDLEARYYLSLASLLGGIVIANAGVIMGHAMAYTFAGYHHVIHGIGCGICLPYAMAYNLPVETDKLVSIAEVIDIPMTGLSKREIAKKVIIGIKEFIESFDMPTSLKSIGIQRKEIPEMVDRLFTTYPYIYTESSPRKLTRDAVEKLYEIMYEGVL
ncbi:MAG: iron-containing alcohol dehydrogenase [Candidatus Aenigmatarchaeota archaeon]